LGGAQTCGIMPPGVPASGRHSSAVEQLFRKQQVLGSNPSVGSIPIFLNQSGSWWYLYDMVGAMEIQAGELVRAAALGDEAAFTELVARHHQDLLRVAYVICRDRALAEDSAQAAWAIAWRRMGDVTDPTRIRGWLVTVAANEARRTMRSRRPSIHEISVGDTELEGVPDLRSDPLAEGIANADLRRVLASLDATDRALIALRYVAELRSDEIGRALGMSSSGARGRLSRLLIRLRGELDDG
jgi:RNA polymerase sigma-70 factor (ECF subfamily)